jgi:hypothetical protein
MPFPTALTSDQLELLRGASGTTPTYASSQYVALCPNVIVFKALVNGAPTGTSYAQITFDNVTTGAYTDIQVGQTVLIGSDSDIRNATFTGRVRATPTSSILYVNETSASITDNSHIWVIDDYRVWDRLARQVGSTQYKDYNISFQQLQPLITNIQSAYIGIATGSPTPVFSVSFAATAIAGTSGATISSYQYTTPDGSVTAGALNTANVTVSFPVGFRWVTLVVTDSGGRTATRRIPVWSVPSDFSSVVSMYFSGVSLQRGDSGDASIEVFDGLGDVLDNTLLVAFSVQYYNGEETNIFTNIDMIGRVRKETDKTVSDATYSQIKSATYDIEGALSQFSRVEHLPFTLTNKATPTVWDQIKDLTIWRAIVHSMQRHTTYLDVFALNFDSTDNTFLYLALPTQGGNILSVIQDLAVSVNANIEVAPTGETRVVRDANWLTGAQRAALPTIMNGTTQDLISIDSLEVTQVNTTGKIQGSGGFYNSTSGKVTPLLSLAPGVAQDIGEGVSSFTRQVLQANQTQAQAQSELNTRTGHEYANKRRAVTTLNLTLPGSYNWIVPSRAQWYTWTLPATETTGQRVFTTAERWQCVGVSVQQNNDTGTKTVSASFQLETSGTPGQTVTYPPVTQIPPIIPTVPTIPPFPTFPPLPDIILPPIPTDEDTPPYTPAPVSNGNTVAVWDTTGNWVASNVFYTNAPTWAEITPDDLTMTDFQWVGLGSKGAYCIGNDDTDSTFFYTPDAISPGAVWTSTSVTGLYRKIRVGSTPGEVYILGGEGDWCHVFDFTIDEQGWDFTAPGFGVYTPGVGFTGQAYGTGGGVSRLNITFSEASLTSITVTHTASGYGAYQKLLVLQRGGDPPQNNDLDGPINGTDVESTYNQPGFSPFQCDDITLFWDGASSSDMTITQIEICGTGFDPFGGSTDQKTRYSTDYGAIFDPEETAAPSPGAFAGFDTQKVGTVVLLGTDGQVMKAVSGGTWGNYGDPFPTGANPSAIWIPAKQFGGTTANSGTNPQYLVASDTLTAGDESLWKVTDSGVTFTDITPEIGGVYGVAVSPDCIAMPFVNGNKIAIIADFDGDIHLLTTTSAGASWTDRGTINAGANYIRFRRGDTQALQLFIANGDELTVSPSLGANLISKTIASDAIIGAEPF